MLLPDERRFRSQRIGRAGDRGQRLVLHSTRSAASVACDIVSATTTAIASPTWRTLPTARTGCGARKKGEPSPLLSGTSCGLAGTGRYRIGCRPSSSASLPVSTAMTLGIPNSTIIAVVEMSQSSWLVGGVVPGIERQPHKKLEPSSERLLALLHRWRDEAVRVGKEITRIALAFEAGRDGFWLTRWLAARGVEAHVIRPSSVAVSRNLEPSVPRERSVLLPRSGPWA